MVTCISAERPGIAAGHVRSALHRQRKYGSIKAAVSLLFYGSLDMLTCLMMISCLRVPDIKSVAWNSQKTSSSDCQGGIGEIAIDNRE